MTCQTCIYFEPSEKAGQRAVLEGFGYCKVAPTLEQRSLFVSGQKSCWLVPVRFRAFPKGEIHGE
ncbi:MAG: hypothetical protein WAV95_15925 [Azonexus sp.]